MNNMRNKGQEQAIAAEGDVLVTASAGTGKTTALVARVINLLKSGAADADELLVVTFTNAAADEMRQKIEKSLNAEIKATGSPRLARQRVLLNNAKICTIDSFCADFVRSHFELAGVDPDFKIADSIVAEAEKNAAFRQTFEEMSRAGDPGFKIMTQCFMHDGIDNLKAHIFNIWKYAVSMPFPEEWLREVAGKCDGNGGEWETEIFSEAGEVITECIDSANGCLSEIDGIPELKKQYDIFTGMLAILCDIQNAVAGGNWDSVREALDNYKVSRLPGENPEYKNICAKLSNVKSSIKEGIDGLRKIFPMSYDEIRRNGELSCEAVKAAVRFTLRMNELFEDGMRASSSYTFDMVERFALRMLCRPDGHGGMLPVDGADILRGKFRAILVDEYQDTNDLQAALFGALAGKPANLFTVGDVKQSIYGFRRADPENFNRRRKELPEYKEGRRDGKIALSINYRSCREICDFVNFTFNILMREKTADIDYGGSEMLVCGSENGMCSGGGVEYHIIDKSQETDITDNKPRGGAAAEEARYIAGYIKRLVNGGQTVPDENNPGARRAVTYGDFAVLMPSPGPKAYVYADEFAKCGVPISVDIKEFWKTQEIMLAVSLLKTVNSPADDIALLAILNSEIFGFTHDRIAVIKAKYRGDTLIARITAAADAGGEDCASFLKVLAGWRIASITQTPGELLARIYDDTALPVIMGAKPNGERRRENLFKLQSYADSYMPSSRVPALSSFLRNIDEGEDIRMPSPCGGNAVRMMSIHGSKGLQFPCCILAGNSKDFNKNDSEKTNVEIDDRLGIGAKYYDGKTGLSYETLPHIAVRLRAKRKETAEKIRLLYVAMTRAEYKLDIVIYNEKLPVSEVRDGTVSDRAILSNLKFSQWLLMAALMHPDLSAALLEHRSSETGGVRIRFAVPSETSDLSENIEHCAAYDERLEKLADNFSYVYPYASVNAVRSKVSVTDLTEKTEDAGKAFAVRPAFARESSANAAETGTAFHRFMQLCDFRKAKQSVRDEINRLAEYEYLSESEAGALIPEPLEAFFNSDIFSRVCEGKIYREFPFVVPYGAAEGGDYTVLQGVVDLASVKDDGILLLDYKTDRVDGADELVNRYGEQIALYRKALEEIFNLPVKECGIYSFRLNEYIRL